MGVDSVVHSYLDSHETIDVDTALELARTAVRDVPRSTVRWRLYEMVQRGALQRLRRGVYTRQDKREFRLTVADSLASLFHAVRKNLPYVELCVWRSDVLQDLTQHFPDRSVSIIEVEKDGEAAVQDFLVGIDQPAVAYEDLPAVDRSFPGQKYVVVKRLVSEAPLTRVDDVTVPRLEKILVDIVQDRNLFGFLEGAETHHIYESASDRYHIQLDTLLRYASRRGAKDEIALIIGQITGNYRTHR
jgi:predicted transcriptional regulator of viral defense system